MPQTRNCLLHVVRWDETTKRHIYFGQSGETTTDRDQAEVWTNRQEAASAAARHDATLLPAFDERDDWDD